MPVTLSLVDSASAIPAEAWTRLSPPNHPFLNPDFLAILEQHGTAGREWGWRAQHVVARDTAGTVVGILPLYAKSNSFGDFTSDWSWASAYAQLGREYYPKLLSGIPHTPATGPRLLVGGSDDGGAVRSQLIAGALALVAEQGLSSWHVAFPSDVEIEGLKTAGLVASQDIQFHWNNPGCGDFDGYLDTFAAAKRRKVRAERRRVRDSGLTIEVRHGDEIDPSEWAGLHDLYAATFEKFSNHAVFTSGCFADLALALGRRMVIFIARQNREPVAVSICFRSNEALYGRYWGCRGNYDSLHFELCFYQGIAYCLEHDLQRFEPGAGGEHKISRGFTPTMTRSLHWIADPHLRQLITRHLARQGAAVAAYGSEAADHLPFRNNATIPNS